MNKEEIEIPGKFVGIKEYKVLFKIMGRMQLHEEEGIVWNNGLQSLLKEKEELLERSWKIKDSKLNKNLEMFMFENEAVDINYEEELYIERYSSIFRDRIKTGVELEKVFRLSAYGWIPEKRKEIEKELGVTTTKELLDKVGIIETIWEEWEKEDSDVKRRLYTHYLEYCYRFDGNFITKEELKKIETEEMLEKYNFYNE